MSQRNANQCSLFNYPFMNKFGFSNNNIQAAPQPEMTIEDAIKIESNSNLQNVVNHDFTGEQSGSALQRTYRLIPVGDHPLLPGSTAGVSVTFQQYKVYIFIICPNNVFF
jgi:hypothetical protein